MATFSMVNAGVSSSGLGDPMESWIPAYAGYKPGKPWDASSGKTGDQNKINQLHRSASVFDKEYYLQSNPDVAKNMLLGQGITSPFEHFIKYGQNEGRSWRTQDRSIGSAGSGNYTNPNWNKSDEPSSNLFGGSGNSTTSSSNSLFGTGGYLGTGVSFDDYVNKMKELTDWRLGIDKRSMENAYGFRNQEATRDYGFNTGLAGQQIQGQKDIQGQQIQGQKDIQGQQIQGQKDIQGQQIEGTKNLETLRNEYMNKRQSEQLANQRAMQEAGFGQQNKLLVDNANRAKSLYFGGVR